MTGKARKIQFLILILVTILLLVTINLTGDHYYRLTVLEDIILNMFSPLQQYITRAGSRLKSSIDALTNYQDLLEENRRLQKEIELRDNQASQILELQKENYRLRRLLGFKTQTTYELLPAEVIARDPSAWFEAVTVNKGYNDGVVKDMSVVTSSGLVGKVLKASRYSSQVMLLTDSRLAVSALVQRSREPGIVGIVEGYPEEPGYLKMTNIPPEGNILPGDTIISSGLGGVYPKGLVIGYVVHVGEDEYGLLQYALLKPAAEFNRLEEVFLVISFETGVNIDDGQQPITEDRNDSGVK